MRLKELIETIERLHEQEFNIEVYRRETEYLDFGTAGNMPRFESLHEEMKTIASLCKDIEKNLNNKAVAAAQFRILVEKEIAVNEEIEKVLSGG